MASIQAGIDLRCSYLSVAICILVWEQHLVGSALLPSVAADAHVDVDAANDAGGSIHSAASAATRLRTI